MESTLLSLLQLIVFQRPVLPKRLSGVCVGLGQFQLPEKLFQLDRHGRGYNPSLHRSEPICGWGERTENGRSADIVARFQIRYINLPKNETRKRTNLVPDAPNCSDGRIFFAPCLNHTRGGFRRVSFVEGFGVRVRHGRIFVFRKSADQ